MVNDIEADRSLLDRLQLEIDRKRTELDDLIARREPSEAVMATFRLLKEAEARLDSLKRQAGPGPG